MLSRALARGRIVHYLSRKMNGMPKFVPMIGIPVEALAAVIPGSAPTLSSNCRKTH